MEVNARILSLEYNNIESLVRNVSCRYINNSTLLKFTYKMNFTPFQKNRKDEKDTAWWFSFVITIDIIDYLLMSCLVFLFPNLLF